MFLGFFLESLGIQRLLFQILPMLDDVSKLSCQYDLSLFTCKLGLECSLAIVKIVRKKCMQDVQYCKRSDQCKESATT